MSTAKHKAQTDALDALGSIIDDTVGRDAIHLAVEPCVAGEPLQPGQHIGITQGHAYKEDCKMLGIVDPFLKNPVGTGERFLMILYPRTITSLRHVWTHPDFLDANPPTGDKKASVLWLRMWCETHDCPSYDIVIKRIRDGDFEGDRFYFDGRDAHDSIPDLFWDHAEVVVGREIQKADRTEEFSCSC